MLIVPPGSGIVHQVNLEYLARVVFTDGNTLYPDSLVGTDSHTTMINGLGVLGWGVGGKKLKIKVFVKIVTCFFFSFFQALKLKQLCWDKQYQCCFLKFSVTS